VLFQVKPGRAKVYAYTCPYCRDARVYCSKECFDAHRTQFFCEAVKTLEPLDRHHQPLPPQKEKKSFYKKTPIFVLVISHSSLSYSPLSFVIILLAIFPLVVFLSSFSCSSCSCSFFGCSHATFFFFRTHTADKTNGSTPDRESEEKRCLATRQLVRTASLDSLSRRLTNVYLPLSLRFAIFYHYTFPTYFFRKVLEIEGKHVLTSC